MIACSWVVLFFLKMEDAQWLLWWFSKFKDSHIQIHSSSELLSIQDLNKTLSGWGQEFACLERAHPKLLIISPALFSRNHHKSLILALSCFRNISFCKTFHESAFQRYDSSCLHWQRLLLQILLSDESLKEWILSHRSQVSGFWAPNYLLDLISQK